MLKRNHSPANNCVIMQQQYDVTQWFPTFLDAFLPLRIFEFFIPPL